jgi:hypothetical protein
LNRLYSRRCGRCIKNFTREERRQLLELVESHRNPSGTVNWASIGRKMKKYDGKFIHKSSHIVEREQQQQQQQQRYITLMTSNKAITFQYN